MKQPQANNRQSLGKHGEDVAARFLTQLGYSIIERNFRIRYGEIDIIARDGETLVFVEVKTRCGRQYGLPEEAVTARKLREIVKTSEFYCLKHPEHQGLQRIDVIAIEEGPSGQIDRIEHIKNASF
jgi:putative endonuclease